MLLMAFALIALTCAPILLGGDNFDDDSTELDSSEDELDAHKDEDEQEDEEEDEDANIIDEASQDCGGTIGEIDDNIILEEASSLNRTFYVEAGDIAKGGTEQETFFFRNLSGNSGASLAIGGEGIDTFVLEFGDTGDDDRSISIVEDFQVEDDVIGVTFHDEIQFDESDGNLYEVRHLVDEIKGEKINGDFKIEISVLQLKSVTSALGESESASLFTRAIVLKDTSEFDLSKIVIRSIWSDFLPVGG